MFPPVFLILCPSRDREKSENQSHTVLPSEDCDGAGVGEPVLLDLCQQLSQLSCREHTRVILCALPSVAGSLCLESAVSLPPKAHIVQIIKHL